MELTLEQLIRLLPNNRYVEQWYNALCTFLPQYEINTPERIAQFMAQCGHESNGFTVLKENLNYRWESLRRVFPKYFPTDALAKQYASLPNKQEAIANRVYANRMGNGPEQSGDGYRYCGRGLIQITGKRNYSDFSNSIGISLEEAPDYLQTFEGAVQSACWFWDMRNINAPSDTGDIVAVTKLINGGTNGLDDRKNRYLNVIEILSD